MLRLAFLLTLLAGVLVSTSACVAPRLPADDSVGVGPGADSTRAALDAARARWQAAGLDGYRFVYELSCFCPEEARGPFTITVRDGAVEEALYNGRPMNPADERLYPSVDALFDTLAEAFDRDAETVRVTYDAALGYPTEAYVDYEAMMADEELRFSVRDLERLGGG